MLYSKLHVSIPLLLAVLLLCGCSARKNTPSPTAVPAETVTDIPAATSAPTSVSSFSEGRTVDGVLTLSDEQLSVTADSGPLLRILPGGTLTASGLLLDRADGTAAAETPGEQQAMILTENGGSTALTACVLASSAEEVPLIAGFGGSTELTDTMAVVSGANAAALLASDSGSIRAVRCDLFADGDNSACLEAKNGGTITCTDGTRVSAAIDGSSAAIRLMGDGSIRMENGTVAGDISLIGYGNTLECTNTHLSGNLRFENAEDEIDLKLQGGSSLLGTTDGDGAIGIRISLDMTSRWILTGDAYVAALTNEDSTLSNIESGGFSLYYNSESEENLWLDGKTIALNGGGYLIPLI